MGAVVVRAKTDFEATDAGIRWDVQKGDLGVLTWLPRKRHSHFLQARVKWDRDPQRKARKVDPSSIVVAGLQTRGIRVMLIPLSR